MRKDANTSTRRATSAEGDSLFAWPRFGLEYTVEPYDESPDLYTFYPEGASDEEIISQWISASEGSVVDITAVR